MYNWINLQKMERTKMCLTLSFVMVSLSVLTVKGRHIADPVLSPTSLSDTYGNSANENSTITWAAMPAISNYKSEDLTYSDGGMGTLYSMATGFVNLCFPGGFPWEAAEKAMNGTLIDDVTSNWQTYASQFAGYAVCIVIGLLFFIIFPIIGFCFCCCRCCGCCGGKMMQRQKDADRSCRRKVYVVSLLVVVAFTLSGMVCVFVSNDQFTKAVDGLDTTLTDTVDDLFTFLNGSTDQITQLVGDNFNFTSDVVKRDLDGIGYLVGVPLRNKLGVDSGLEACFTTTYGLVTLVDNATTDLLQVNASLAAVDDAFDDLDTALSTFRTNLQTTLSSCTGAATSICASFDISSLQTDLNAAALPDISNQVDKVVDIQNSNLTSKIQEGEESYWEIPWKVHNETNSTVQTLKDKLDEIYDLIDPLMDTVTSFSISSSDVTDLYSDYLTFAKDYNQYRWYGGIGLACIVLLVVALQLLGLVFALIGFDSKVDPTERGCMSNSGGEMFMASVGFVFIFSSLLMLLTTLTYLIGAPLERFVCQPVTDNNMADLDRLVDEIAYKQLYSGGTGSLLGKLLYSNETYDLPLSGFLTDCRSGQTLYRALEVATYVNLSQIEDYRTEFDIESELDNIDDNVDFSSITILTPSLLSNLEDTKTAVDVDFAGYKSELNKDATQVNLTEFSASIRNLSSLVNTAGDSTSAAALNTRANELDTIQSTEVAALDSAVATLAADLDTLESTVNGTDASVDAVINCLNSSELYIQANTSALLTSEASAFAERVFSVVDSYINNTFDALKTEVGVCSPIWTLFNNLFIVTFCGYIVDTLNGFWFALGWCIFFFVPGIIFAVKLAKHFRRMKELEKLDDPKEYSEKPGLSDEEEFKRTDARPVFKGNKVGHSDTVGNAYPAYAEVDGW